MATIDNWFVFLHTTVQTHVIEEGDLTSSSQVLMIRDEFSVFVGSKIGLQGGRN